METQFAVATNVAVPHSVNSLVQSLSKEIRGTNYSSNKH